MPTNVCVPFFKPGQDITGYLTVDLGGKTLVAAVAGGRGGQPHIGLPAAGAAVMGVLGHDGVAGQYVHVNSGGVVPVIAGADVTAGTEVMTNAAGHVVPHTVATAPAKNVPVGYVVAGATSGNAAAVKLYG